jgi:hypothetical protein
VSRDDAPEYKRVEVCFFCKFADVDGEFNKCLRHDFTFEPKEASAKVCKDFVRWTLGNQSEEVCDKLQELR